MSNVVELLIIRYRTVIIDDSKLLQLVTPQHMPSRAKAIIANGRFTAALNTGIASV